MAIKSLEINSKEIHLMKSVTSADYSGKTVLTNSSWEYVELWLKRQSSEKSKRALFYWSQAKNFYGLITFMAYVFYQHRLGSSLLNVK